MADEVVKIAGLRLTLEGENEFSQGLKNASSKVTDARLEFKKWSAENKLTETSTQTLTEKVGKLTGQMDAQANKNAEIQRVLAATKEKYGENSAEAQKLAQELEKGRIKEQEFKNSVQLAYEELYKQDNALINVGESLQTAGGKIEKVGEGMQTAGSALTKTVTTPLLAGGTAAVKASIDFDTAFTGVKKTVDGTEEDFANLKTGIMDMSQELPASAKEIANVAEAAGQLGIKKENILEFSRTMIDMGESTNLSSDQASESMAQFANIVQMSQDDFDRLGSSIVDLGNHGASTEADIMAMTTRLAAAGHQVGMTEPEIVGLAASMADLGIEAEMGGSAMSKLLINMQVAATNGQEANKVIEKTGYNLRDLQMMASHDAESFGALAESMGYTKAELKGFVDASSTLEQFSEVTGMTAEQFKQAFEEDAVGALAAFMKGLQDANLSGDDAITVLDNMGITEVRLRDTILRTVSAGDAMVDSVKRSNDAWESNTALTEEANKRYESTASQLEIAKNKITAAAISIGEDLAPTVVELMDSVAGLAEKFADLDPEMQKTIIKAAGIAAAAGPVLKIGGQATEGLGKITSGLGKLLEKAGEKKAIADAAEAVAGLGGESLVAGDSVGYLVGGLGGIGGVVGIAAAAIGITAIALQGVKTDTDLLNDALDNTSAAAANFQEGIETATPSVSNFASENENTVNKLSALRDKIGETQPEITMIYDEAASNRRAITQEEMRQLQAYLDKLGEFTDETIASYEQQLQVLKIKIDSESQMNEDAAQAHFASLGVYRDQAMELIDEQYEQELNAVADAQLRAQELRDQGHDEEAAAEDRHAAQLKQAADIARQNRIADLDDETGTVAARITERYGQYSAENLSGFTNLEQLRQDYIAAEDEANAKEAALRAKNAEDHALTNAQMGREIASYHQDEIQKREAYNSAMADFWDDEVATQAGSLLSMVTNTIMYGGEIDDETAEMVANVLNTMGTLPPEMEDAGLDAITAVIDAFTEKNPDLKAKAQQLKDNAAAELSRIKDGQYSNGADAVNGLMNGMESKRWPIIEKGKSVMRSALNAMKMEARISSPSKETMWLAEMLGEGLTVQMDKDEVKIAKSGRDLMRSGLEAIEDETNGFDYNIPVTGDLRSLNTSGALQTYQQSVSSSAYTYAPIINIDNPVIRSDQDIRDLTRQFSQVLAQNQKRVARGAV